MKVGIVCPSRFEYEALDRARLTAAGAVVELSGMGKLRAMLGCLRLYELGAARILMVGFCGGLTPDLSVGDVIEPSVFIEQDYCAEPFEKFPNRISGAKRRLVTGSVRAAMITQDHFVTENPYEAGKLKHRFRSIACDMESYAAARFCAEKKLRFAAVKIVSDSADENADHDFLKACRRLSPKLNRVTAAAAKAFSKGV